MGEDAELRGTTTLDGFRVLWVGIKREPIVFTVATLGAVLFGVLTVADAWVLGWATQHVLIPAFETGEIGTDMLIWVVALVNTSNLVTVSILPEANSEIISMPSRATRNSLVASSIGK